MMAFVRLTKSSGRQLIDSVTSVIFDCDGVIWHPTGVIDGAAALVDILKKMGKKVIFVTNNNTKSQKQLHEKFRRLGIGAEEDEVFGTARVAAVYLKHVLKCDKKAFLVGGIGIAEELKNVGIQHTPMGPCPLPGDSSVDVPNRVDLSIDKEIGSVVVGFDEHISYQKIASAMRLLTNSDVHFIATNTDSHFPMGDGTFIPGSGVMVNAIQTASHRDPIVMGKPEKPMIDAVRAIHSIEPSKTLMIGDRLGTDISFGNRTGMKTLAVLSGVTSLKEIDELSQKEGSSELIPNFVADSVKDLLLSLEN
eukprot:Seg382.9 transcript_id=Seg382.9/GoldUCD/mRNA.D3Y31 product="Glycerol-3-phosphate phosphatase" protein_id=Seg382.9/GoldUCD/D3Y31